jgi:hypothetical protein
LFAQRDRREEVDHVCDESRKFEWRFAGAAVGSALVSAATRGSGLYHAFPAGDDFGTAEGSIHAIVCDGINDFDGASGWSV